ncbi:cytochrome c peroxidase [Hymenobacter daecheongensis DSM 21074]|uniref:Cytochrome c peroxidase n=1 Tax=Hymenobacter daecheongensis DSM 21074 TaxID=1121955 RepID=A0A1M6FZC4_9BACT|nr:cytochrome c peroxidase [Hymenobacter daecheongensis]SHJ03036.1 cytochrome c peroxidase [Hymenobacter daecheongensis DSM 21074]
MRRTLLLPLAFGLAAVWMTGCAPDADMAPEQAVPGAVLPVNFPAPVYGPEQNPPTKEAFELGRSLFYDPRLSRDGTISCGSCHQQFVAFAHAGHTVSHGIEGRLGTRNAPPLQNLRWRRGFMWDGGPNHLEVIPLAPLTNPLEMDETLDNVLRKLNADLSYQQRFQVVFSKQPIDSYQLLKALAQFMAALTSANSRYDHFVRGEAGGTLTEPELRGRAVLVQQCASCHATDLFTDESFRNNGLDRSFAADSGRAHITGLAADQGKFKVPSLRNVALTAPYMHDGRFQTLRQVLDHYDHGVVESATLDPILRQPGGRLGLPLTPQEKNDLLAFLNTLTDAAFLTDKRLAEQR